MRKVRYLEPMGVPKGDPIVPGQEAEVGDDEAERLIAKGFAEPLEPARGKRAKSPATERDDK